MGGGRQPGQFLGHEWGDFGAPSQKGITTYVLSPNRQRPLAGAMRNAIFNTWRRSSAQFLYVIPPFVGLYYLMSWAGHRNEFLNSKEGRKLYAETDE